MLQTVLQLWARAAVMTAVAATIVALAPGGARASSLCADRRVIVERLTGADVAPRRAYAAQAAAGLVEIFASERGGWTILVTSPDGLTCVVAAGDGGGPKLAVNLPKEGA